jgi:FADH2 O2-dependent halogenase
MNSYCEAVDAGTMDKQAAADDLYAELARANWHPPAFGLADRNRRFINTSPPLLAKMGRWSVRHAPPDMREYMVGTSKEAMKHLMRGKRIF